MERTKTVTTESTHTVRISRADLIKFVKGHYAIDLPDSTEVFVHVPGYTDCLNTNLDIDIDGDEEVVVRWKESDPLAVVVTPG